MKTSVKVAALLALVLCSLAQAGRAKEPASKAIPGVYENTEMTSGKAADLAMYTQTIDLRSGGTVSYTFLTKTTQRTDELHGKKIVAKIRREDPLSHEVATRTYVWPIDGDGLLGETDHPFERKR